MLSEENKNAIRLEEIYRNEVRDEIESKAPKSQNKLLSFLDTQHGLFIASTLVLPLMLWFFAFSQAKYTEFSSEQKLISRIDNEITYRLSNYRARLEGGDVIGFIGDIDSHYVYPEFSGVGVQGLMLQLESLVCESKRTEITTARNALVSADKEDIEKALIIRGWNK